MAFSALLRRGATTYSLTISNEWSPPNLNADVSIIGGSGAASPRLVSESMGGPTALTLPLRFRLTTQALLQAEIDALDAYLRLGECTLEVTFTDAAAATIWTVYHAQPVQPPFTRFANVGHEVEASLTLAVSPFVTTAEVALYTAEAIDAPASLDLSTMAGNYLTPLTIDAGAIGADTHSLYLAVDASGYDAYRSRAADLTWGAGATDTADADANSGVAVYVRSTTPVTTPVDTAAYPEGPYLILARVKVLLGETGSITTDYTDGVVSFTRGTYHIVELGTCYLPTKAVRNAAAAELTVSLCSTSATAGHEACIDWIYALPTGGGMFSYHPASDTVDATTIGRDAATAKTYVDDVASEQHVTGNTLMALGGTLLVVAEEAAGTEPDQPLAITLAYTPRFAWMR